jgi:hypothetical protein
MAKSRKSTQKSAVTTGSFSSLPLIMVLTSQHFSPTKSRTKRVKITNPTETIVTTDAEHFDPMPEDAPNYDPWKRVVAL